jgi:hypothetical protein
MKYWGTNNTLANISLNLAPERSGAGSDKILFIMAVVEWLLSMIRLSDKYVNSFDMHGSYIIG